VPATARRAPVGAALLAAVLGLALLVLGAWAAIGLGPSGRAEFSSTHQTPGVLMVGSPVLGHVAAPVEVRLTRVDGGAVWLGLAHDADARAAVGSSPFLSVDRVHYPSGAVDVSIVGKGASTARPQSGDIWQHTSTGTGTAQLVLSPGNAPQSVVAASADTAALGRVRVTLAWESRTWFFEALAAAGIGLVIAGFSLGFLWQARRATTQERATRAGSTPAERSARGSVGEPDHASSGATRSSTERGQAG
jgi:hypothetical protein